MSLTCTCDHATETHCLCWCHEIDKLKWEVAELELDLCEYGRHAEGCPAQHGNYPCKCGWAEVEARLIGDESAADRKET